MTQKGFTVLELLVVIIILLIMFLTLVSTLSQAKISAEEFICRTNLFKHYMASEIYSLDNNYRYPSPYNNLYKEGVLPGETNIYCRWHNENYNLESFPEFRGSFWPYLNNNKILICPVFKKNASKYGTNHFKHSDSIPITVQYSYSINGTLKNKIKGKYVGIKQTQIKSSPSKTFLWSEENICRLTESNGNYINNYILDDNVLNILEIKVITDVFGSFGSFHDTSVSQIPEGNKREVYKSGSVNAVMIDGSLISVSPLDSLTYRGKI